MRVNYKNLIKNLQTRLNQIQIFYLKYNSNVPILLKKLNNPKSTYLMI